MAEPDYRLIQDPPGDGAWNMAVDQALLHAAADGGPVTLRLYRWERPTLSLGYFQAHAERDAHAASRGADLVRRQSGGGAILHDHELTYSLVIPPGRPLATQTQALYDTVHESLIAILTALPPLAADSASLQRFEAADGALPTNEPFLCFERRSAGDILLSCGSGSHKIVGSAQRRWRGAVLQHGSILLRRSVSAPELPGFCDLTKAEENETERALRQELPQLLTGSAGGPFEESSLPDGLHEAAAAIAVDRYRSKLWTQRR
ncbi:MAG: lipoate--protein ligase [Planctomycetota bacterium]